MRRFASTLNARVLAGALVMGALVVAVGLLAMAINSTVRSTSRAILTENVSSLKAAAELELALLDYHTDLTRFVLGGDEHSGAELSSKMAKFWFWYDQSRQVALTSQEQVLLQRFGLFALEYEALQKRIQGLLERGAVEGARQLLLQDTEAVVDHLHQACEDLLFLNEQLIAELHARSERTVAWLQGIMWGGIAAAVILGLAGGWLSSRRLMRRLVESEKLATLGQMAGLVAHEVRNPLTAINMRVHSLREELQGFPSCRDDVDVIGEEIERLEGVVRNFLDLVRLPEPSWQPVDLAALTRQCLDLLGPALSGQGIRTDTRWPDAPALVTGDRHQIKQVLLNVLLNAVQAMPTGGHLRLEIRLVSDRSGPPRMEWVASDSGPGIPEALRRKVFDPFFTTKANGVGLGLSLVRKVVDRHGGRISLRCGPQGGTTVIVELPAKATDPVPPRQPAAVAA